MTNYIKTLACAGILCLSGGAVLAQSDMDVTTLTCEEFLAMDEEGQMAATEAAYAAIAETTGSSAPMEPMTEEQTAAVMTECEVNPATLAVDAIGGATSR